MQMLLVCKRVDVGNGSAAPAEAMLLDRGTPEKAGAIPAVSGPSEYNGITCYDKIRRISTGGTDLLVTSNVY